ncbi:unnamed protein product [Ophioblennius macclurei]
MEEESTIPQDSAKNCISVIDNERVKDVVCKYFKDKVDANNAEESLSKENGTLTKKDKEPLSKAHCRGQQGAVFSGKILSFGCSLCKDNCTFSPNDLLKHFQAVHTGALPTYPCDLCEFVTNEFPVLQRHRIAHRNTLVTCELCNDDIQYSLLLLTRHYIVCHSVNGQFTCDWCDFRTMDAGTFVQHIHHHNERHWKCSKCKHISLNEEDHQKHLKAHSGTFPFTCPLCGYGATKIEFLRKHTASVHKEDADWRDAWRSAEESSTPANASNLKVLLKKSGESPEGQRLLNSFSGSLPSQNGRVFKPEISLEDAYHLTDGTLLKKDNKSKVSQSTDLSTPIALQESENSSSSDAGSHNNANGVTVLMVKNKISLPANCTTKVMGFKVVDGKKHLVLKVVPTANQELSTSNHSIVEGVCSPPSNPTVVKGAFDNGECSDGITSASHGLAVSPKSPSGIQIDQNDIMAVKVKSEEEEMSICNSSSFLHRDNMEAPTSPLINGSATASDMSYPTRRDSEDDGDQSHPIERTYIAGSMLGNESASAICISDVTSLNCSQASHSTMLCDGEGANCGAADELNWNEELAQRHKGKGTKENNNSCSESTTQTSDTVRSEDKHHNGLTPLSQLITSACRTENATGSEKCAQSSPTQEVFTFHNYSKEIFGASPNTTQNSGYRSEHSADKESVHESSQLDVTLTNSPEPFTDSDDDSEVDEYEASDDDPLDEENPDSVLQDFNIIKIEEENIPISKKHQETNSGSHSLETFVKEHSDVIIAQQLSKEQVAPSRTNIDPVKPTKTTLRLLQLPDGKPPVLLRATDNRFAMPVQVKTSPGFKLITNCANPQINVSYMKQGGLERSSATTGLSLTPNSRKVGLTAGKPESAERGKTLLSAAPPGVGPSTNHYLINSPGLKGPVFLSSTPHNTPTDKTAKTQPTCYLVQRSVQFAQNPNASHLKLSNTPLSLNSRPVLAMPVNSADKTNTLPGGRQAFLLRYISPPKSGLLLNNQEAKIGTQCSQTSESSGGKVIFKIVSPSGSLLTSGAQTSSNQPLFLATRPQTQCFLVSSNKTNANATDAVKKLIHLQNTSKKDVNDSCILHSRVNVKVQSCEADKPILAPRPIRPPSQRKRRRKALFDELPAMAHKARKLSNKASVETETTALWNPVAKEVERTLRLAPFRAEQQIKCPRRYQPVVVLNHPDADIPEVANIMKVVSRYKGAVTKVALSQKTIQVLSELSPLEANSLTKGTSSQIDRPRPRPVRSSVRERFLLKMKLRKKSKRKYEVVKGLSACRQQQVFSCWFCGRLFSSQEDWIGHGQRHLMEATRDWNQLF